ncbi:uncharacterized protein BDZ83DRAFT_772676, partial [Colletotrichum acutatum]
FGSTGPKTEFHPSASLRVYAPFWKVWWKEILCIIASIASFIAIVIVLASYDNHNLPTWRFKITLNTFLAFFTTLAKGAFMLPVSLAFSQSKFTWFLKPNPLYDFYILDQASRGWLGSLKLLFRVRFKHTVTIGAILMIVSNLSSPVTQLAISYPLRNNTASEEEAKMFTIDEITLGHNYARKLAETASLKATLPDNGDYEVPAPPQKALCSTGNCDFGPYQSLGVCVKTANITSKLLTKPISNLTLDLFEDGNGGLIPGLKEWNVSLSGKYGMLHQSPLTVISGELEGADTFGYSNNTRLLKARLLFYFLIYTSPLSPSKTQNLPADSDAIDDVIDSITEFKYEAREVLFHICVQTFKTRVRAGLDETSISDTVSQIDDPSNGIVLGRKCTKEVCQPLEEPGDLVAQITPPNAGPRKFSASYATMWNMAMGISILLNGKAELRITPNETLNHFWFSSFPRAWYRDVTYSNKNVFNPPRREIHLNNFLLNIATSVSSDLRYTHGQDGRPGAVVIDGTPLKEVSYLHIIWGVDILHRRRVCCSSNLPYHRHCRTEHGISRNRTGKCLRPGGRKGFRFGNSCRPQQRLPRSLERWSAAGRYSSEDFEEITSHATTERT